MKAHHEYTYDIRAREACECPKPLPDQTHHGFRKCRLCCHLIPKSRFHRARLIDERYEIDMADGLLSPVPRTKTLSKAEVRRLVDIALAEDPGASNTKLRRMLSDYGTPDFGGTVWGWICRDARDELGIEPRKGGKNRAQCVTDGCFRVPVADGRCLTCQPVAA